MVNERLGQQHAEGAVWAGGDALEGQEHGSGDSRSGTPPQGMTDGVGVVRRSMALDIDQSICAANNRSIVCR